MIRRLKDDVLNDLPDKIRQHIYIPINSAKLEKELKESMDDMNLINGNFKDVKDLFELDVNNKKRNNTYLNLYKKTGLAKLPAVLEYLESMIESNEKFIVFGHHKEVLDEVQAFIEKEKLGYIRIDGSTPTEKRQDRASKFQNELDCRVAILSITAA
jgi:SWI/SNF-related matrix-associated actin-dependent regulator of chromatin subfamily A-like protein 1